MGTTTSETASETTHDTRLNEAFPLGGGQSGGGTASPLSNDTSTTFALDRAEAETERSKVHGEAPNLAAAAVAANQQPAPSDPMEQILASLHARVTSLENAAVSPEVVSDVATLKSTVDALITMAEKNAPLMDRVWHLFNVHWAGKLPSDTGGLTKES